jgi:hypothetical protein
MAHEGLEVTMATSPTEPAGPGGPRVKARIAMHRGAPTLFIDGRPAAALAYMTFNLQEKYVRDFARAGVELFSFETTADYDYYRLSADAWPARDAYDYSQFEERMEMILRAAPGAKVFPRVSLCSPPWWDRAHPDQLMAGKNGVYDPPPDFGWLPASVSEQSLAPPKMTVPSFSSRAWLEDSGAALRRFLRLAEEKYGHAIIGYHLVSGGSQEWYYWGAFENVFPDPSAPQAKAFREWLRDHEWIGVRDQGVPPVADRLRSEFGWFRDPTGREAALAIEYLRFHSEAVVRAMGHFARAAREVIGPDKLIGVFYGYFVDLCRHPTCWHSSGHLAMRSFMADANIDFVASPTAYKDRRAVVGFSLFNSLTESLAHRGKLWWDENDILTERAPALKDPLFLRPQSALESRHIQRREFANVLCHGAGQWWFDMWGGYHDDPEAMADIARMVRVGRKQVHLDRSSAAEIAVVLDDDSIHFTRCDNRLTVPLIADQLMQLGHAGAPFSMIHVDDLVSLPPHKLYIFLDLFYANEERVRMVREVTRRPGVTALYFYAPGLVGEDIAAERMERLTGICLVLDPRAAVIRVRVSDEGEAGAASPLRKQRGMVDGAYPAAPAAGSAARGVEYGMTEPLAPVVYAADPQAECLGRLAGSDRAGLVRKRVGGGTAIFSAAPAMPAEMVRRLASEAGVHIYADGGEVVYANRSFLAVCGPPGARVRLRLPAPGHLYDVFEKKEVALPAGEALLPPSSDGVSIFFRGRRKEWDAIAT